MLRGFLTAHIYDSHFDENHTVVSDPGPLEGFRKGRFLLSDPPELASS